MCWLWYFRISAIGQTFVAPQLPQGRTLDGQTFGEPRVPEGTFQSSGVEVLSQGGRSQGSLSEGRIIEGRVLTGPNGQAGDMTLRFPQNGTQNIETGSQSDDGSMVFGPIDIEPLQGRVVPNSSSPTERQRGQEIANRRRNSKSKLPELPNREIILQRYPDGNVHIARHVKQDMEGNWVNDGQWKLFDQQGAMIASGNYRNGAMEGKWSRLHTAGSGGIFSNPPFIEFDGPYASHARFEAGKLSSVWEIRDRSGQKIFEMPYKNGKRNGVAVWYLPQGKIYRRMEFEDDVPVGNLVEYDRQGKVARKETYKNGMKIVNNVSYYRPSGQKRQESIVRKGRLELQGDDDWWEAKPAPMVVTGQDVQHGPIRTWYDNGQTKMVGNLVEGVRVGQFIWWHRNGTKQLIGQYDRSGEKVGRWRWWHANGIKSIDGSYTENEADGSWQWWNDQGELINKEDFDPDAQPLEDDFGADEDSQSSKNPDDAFGESFDDEDSILDGYRDPVDTDELDNRDDIENFDSDLDPNSGETPRSRLDTDALEGIDFSEAEEIPEPESAATRQDFLNPQARHRFQLTRGLSVAYARIPPIPRVHQSQAERMSTSANSFYCVTSPEKIACLSR